MKRSLPKWLNELNDEKQIEGSTSKDTNNTQLLDIVNNSSISPKLIRTTRSNSVKEEVKPKINLSECKFIEYKGQIKYYTTLIDIACACDDILQWIENSQRDVQIVPIAFDMEWPFSFQTGPGKSSVIQLCAEENTCYVFSVGELKKLPSALTVLLMHPKVLLHGVNIKNDFRKLQRDFPETNSDFLISKCRELSEMCNLIKNTSGRWSLERLVNYLCCLQMNKSKTVRMSKWNVIPLDENQLMYAAIDVYIGQIIYRKLEYENNNKTLEDLEDEIILKKLNLD